MRLVVAVGVTATGVGTGVGTAVTREDNKLDTSNASNTSNTHPTHINNIMIYSEVSQLARHKLFHRCLNIANYYAIRGNQDCLQLQKGIEDPHEWRITRDFIRIASSPEYNIPALESVFNKRVKHFDTFLKETSCDDTYLIFFTYEREDDNVLPVQYNLSKFVDLEGYRDSATEAIMSIAFRNIPPRKPYLPIVEWFGKDKHRELLLFPEFQAKQLACKFKERGDTSSAKRVCDAFGTVLI
jgi:hypothetical protein